MISFQVSDMSCNHCVKSITQAVLALDAGALVQVDLAQHRVSVQSASATAEAVAQAIQAAGYTPTPLKAP